MRGGERHPVVTQHSALTGQGLLQSCGEWARRNEILVSALCALAQRYLRLSTGRGVDVGCQKGDLTDIFAERTRLTFWGIDPEIREPRLSSEGIELLPGYAHRLPFPDSHFDCVILANVYEHIAPEWRVPSLSEMRRVLTQGGILIGQLPNPFFPIESHSRLPFMGWLPHPVRKAYWRLAPVPWSCEEAHFFIVTIKNLKSVAESVGLETLAICNFNYPVDAIPQAVRWAARLHNRLRLMPWAWQFVFRKA